MSLHILRPVYLSASAMMMLCNRSSPKPRVFLRCSDMLISLQVSWDHFSSALWVSRALGQNSGQVQVSPISLSGAQTKGAEATKCVFLSWWVTGLREAKTNLASTFLIFTRHHKQKKVTRPCPSPMDEGAACPIFVHYKVT